jgi:hypothetical protein
MSFKKKDASPPVGRQQAQPLTHLHQNNKEKSTCKPSIPNAELEKIADLKKQITRTPIG